jgi:2-keto-4-pentenoate hydratase/2-oxohepta-3-ene-1,7-dioic acid hydratase in catechol pathway
MRIVRYRTPHGPAWGVLDPDGLVRAASGTPFVDLAAAAEVLGEAERVPLLAPAAPSKVICVGRNYREHAAEFGNPLPSEPLLFMKPPSAVIGPGAAIHYPAISQRVDPEAELVVVIGREAHRVSAANAMAHVGGYTCGNDVTARDIQKADGQWTRGKGFDTFCPIGPWIETELDPGDLRVICTVDGELRQDGRTRDLIFPIPFLIEYISRFTRLLPGDLIMTGTPAGVAPIATGSTVTVEIEGIGALTNPVIAEPD